MTSPPDPLAERYLKRIAALPAGQLTKARLMTPDLRLHHEAGFSIYYAPFDYIHRPAKVAVVGITPGWQQMQIACRVARARLAAGDSAEQALRAVKEEASFAGAMRVRMCGWFDELGLPALLGLASSAELFSRGGGLLHTTSAVRYPVIKSNGENWSGSGPSPTSSSVLRGYVHDVLAPELAQVESALVVPLGAAVAKALDVLVAAGRLDERRVLTGFPHPSGLNTRGPAAFVKQRAAMRRQVAAWFGDYSPPPTSRRCVCSGYRTRQEVGAPPRAAWTSGASPARKLPGSATLPDRVAFQALILTALGALGGSATRGDIKARALDLGAFTATQLEVPPPPAKVRSYPNQIAYQLDWAMNALKTSGDIRSPARTVWDITSSGRRRLTR